MIRQDVVTLSRILLAEPINTNSRWSDGDLVVLETEAEQSMALDIEWPESTFVFSTDTGVPEYTLPIPIESILRVYVNGQACPPTSIPILEGDPLELYDQSVSTTFQPGWMGAPSATYPVSNDQVGNVAAPVPWFTGLRPSYYIRGANLGLVPTPSAIYPVQLDIITFPPPNASPAITDPIIYPAHFKRALAWKVCELAWAGDAQHTSGDTTFTNYAMGKYESELTKLRSWRDNLQRALPRRPQVNTYRNAWAVQSPTTWGGQSGDPTGD